MLPTFQHRGPNLRAGTLDSATSFEYATSRLAVSRSSCRSTGAMSSTDEPPSGRSRGYLLGPHGEVAIEGYRLNQEAVAAFRFSSVPRSYASRMGDARDVGVIGAAGVHGAYAAITPAPARPYESSGRDRAAPELKAAPGAASEAGAPAPTESFLRESRRAERPGLGTEFAEEHGSHVEQVSFERAGSRPDTMLTLRYDDRQGLIALGIDVDRRGACASSDSSLREAANPFRENAFAEPPPGWRSR